MGEEDHKAKAIISTVGNFFHGTGKSKPSIEGCFLFQNVMIRFLLLRRTHLKRNLKSRRIHVKTGSSCSSLDSGTLSADQASTYPLNF